MLRVEGASSATQWPAGMRRQGLEHRLRIVLPPHTHLISGLGWRRLSPRLTDHNLCLLKGISVGLEAGGRSHRSAPPGVLPLLSSPQGQCQRKSSAITLYPTDNMATPGGSRVPSQGDPRNPCECLRVSGLLEGHRDQNPPFPPNLKSQALETMGDKMSLGKVQRLVT